MTSFGGDGAHNDSKALAMNNGNYTFPRGQGRRLYCQRALHEPQRSLSIVRQRRTGATRDTF